MTRTQELRALRQELKRLKRAIFELESIQLRRAKPKPRPCRVISIDSLRAKGDQLAAAKSPLLSPGTTILSLAMRTHEESGVKEG